MQNSNWIPRYCVDHQISNFGSGHVYLIYRIRSNATPGFYFSKLVFGWGSIQIWCTWGCIRDGVLLFKESQIKLIFVLDMRAVSRFQNFYFCIPNFMTLSLSDLEFQALLTSWCEFDYLKNAKFGRGEVVFELGLYFFKISFWLEFYYFFNEVRFYSRVGLHLHGYGM